jgi:hypothetical protein
LDASEIAPRDNVGFQRGLEVVVRGRDDGAQSCPIRIDRATQTPRDDDRGHAIEDRRELIACEQWKALCAFLAVTDTRP